MELHSHAWCIAFADFLAIVFGHPGFEASRTPHFRHNSIAAQISACALLLTPTYNLLPKVQVGFGAVAVCCVGRALELAIAWNVTTMSSIGDSELEPLAAISVLIAKHLAFCH
jgi:hypothetical protein